MKISLLFFYGAVLGKKVLINHYGWGERSNGGLEVKRHLYPHVCHIKKKKQEGNGSLGGRRFELPCTFISHPLGPLLSSSFLMINCTFEVVWGRNSLIVYLNVFNMLFAGFWLHASRNLHVNNGPPCFVWTSHCLESPRCWREYCALPRILFR